MTRRFFDGGREPGVASRRASTGSTLVARRAGTRAATTVTQGADEQRDPDGAWLELHRRGGQAEADDRHQGVEPLGDADAQADADGGGAEAEQQCLDEQVLRTWRRVAPTARSRAISRERWVTIIVNVFQMMNEPTNSAMPAKIMNMMLTNLRPVLDRVGRSPWRRARR